MQSTFVLGWWGAQALQNPCHHVVLHLLAIMTHMLRCVCITPLGFPMVPEVHMITAKSSGSGVLNVGDLLAPAPANLKTRHCPLVLRRRAPRHPCRNFSHAAFAMAIENHEVDGEQVMSL